jgi:hypothetical protein
MNEISITFDEYIETAFDTARIRMIKEVIGSKKADYMKVEIVAAICELGGRNVSEVSDN